MDNLFVESTDDIIKLMTDEFESLRGEVLMESDARKMLIRATALGIILAGNKLNSAARNRFLKYCDESTLDLFAEDKGINTRYQAKTSLTTMKFTRIKTDTIQAIPYGVRITNTNKTIIFTIIETKSFGIGETELEVSAECTVAGSFANDFVPGTFNILLDTIPYISAVANTTKTNGGSDIEDVEAYRERIRIAPESYSCAGTKGAYEFWAKSAESSISDVFAYMASPGTVGIRVLLEGGILPSQEVLNRILAVVGSDKIRGLTDNVITSVPTLVEYSIDFDYYIPKEQEQFAISIQKNVLLKCAEFEYANGNKLGIDVNPQQLESSLINLGVKRTEKRNPPFIKLDKTQIAVCSGVTANYKGVEDD